MTLADAQDVIHAVRKLSHRYRRGAAIVSGWRPESLREAA
jgi:hypothetical protein